MFAQGLPCVYRRTSRTKFTFRFFRPSSNRTLAVALIAGLCVLIFSTVPSAACNLVPANGIACVQSNSATINASSGSIAFTSNNTAGNLIAVVLFANGGDTSTPTDSRNSYLPAVLNQLAGGAGQSDRLSVYYAQNIGAGANTVSVSAPGATLLQVVIFEYSGLGTANALDQAGGASGTNSVPVSPSVTTTSPQELVLGVEARASSGAISAGSGYRLELCRNSCSNGNTGTEDQILSAAQSLAATWGGGNVGKWAAAIATFRTTCGPPHYPCSTNSTSATGTLSPAASYVFQQTDTVNTTRYDTTLNLSGTDCYTQLTDENTFGEPLAGLTYDGGSGTQQASLNGDFITIVNTNSKILKINTTGNCAQVVWPAPGQPVTNHVKGNALFSAVTDNLIYQESGAQLQTVTIIGGTDPTTISAPTTIFDYSWCPHTPGVSHSPVGQTGYDIGGADAYFIAGFSWSEYGENGNQGSAHNMYIFKKATHQCATLDLAHSNGDGTYSVAIYDWCDPDANGHSSDHGNCQGVTQYATSTQCTGYDPTVQNSGFHGMSLEPQGITASGGYQCPNQQPPAAAVYWFYGSGAHVATNVQQTGNGLYTGHGELGETGVTEANNPSVAFSLYSQFPNGGGNVAGPFAGFGKCEMHPSWANQPVNGVWDVWDSMYTMATCDETGNGSGSLYGTNLPNPYENEFIGINNLTVGDTIPRLGHNFSTGNPSAPANQHAGSNFTCMYSQHFMSQDGKWIFFSSPMLGNLGCIWSDGTINSCSATPPPPVTVTGQNCRAYVIHAQ
jgi:hypothetical protein